MHTVANDLHIIIFSDNTLFCEGVKYLLDDFSVMQYTDAHINNHHRYIVCIDSKILLSGKISHLMQFISTKTLVKIIWLVTGYTGLIYPLWSYEDCIVNINDEHLIRKLKHSIQCKNSKPRKHYKDLNTKEKIILNYLSKGLNISQIALITDKTTKTIYTYRTVIMHKLGYRNVVFFQHIFMKNREFMWKTRLPERTAIL